MERVGTHGSILEATVAYSDSVVHTVRAVDKLHTAREDSGSAETMVQVAGDSGSAELLEQVVGDSGSVKLSVSGTAAVVPTDLVGAEVVP